MDTSMFHSFKELTDNLKSLTPKTIVVAAAHDKNTLNAVYAASKKLPVKYILVGNRNHIMSLSAELDVTPNEDRIIDCDDFTDCAKKAVALIREGRGDVLMKGILDTATLLKAVLNKENGIKDRSTMSHVSMMEVPGYHKLIAVTDAAMLTYPTLNQKADIAKNAIAFYRKLNIPTPKIAALCAVETVSDKMPETDDAEKLRLMCEDGQLGKAVLEGPISFDLAVSAKSANIKGFDSRIAGDTDIFLVPNITVGNVLCKSLIYWGGAKMAGCVLGAKAPIVLVSRAATSEEKLYSIAISLY